MSDIKKCTTIEELKAHVATFGPRKQFNPGDEIVCVQKPYGQKSPRPGDRVVVIEPCKVYPMNDGTPCASGEFADYVGAALEEGHPEGFLARHLNSCFFVPAAEYTEPAKSEET